MLTGWEIELARLRHDIEIEHRQISKFRRDNDGSALCRGLIWRVEKIIKKLEERESQILRRHKGGFIPSQPGVPHENENVLRAKEYPHGGFRDPNGAFVGEDFRDADPMTA
jgi:hypothetical protein